MGWEVGGTYPLMEASRSFHHPRFLNPGNNNTKSKGISVNIYKLLEAIEISLSFSRSVSD